MAALLRLAKAVGPFIAVLQVHADIIDDWSPEGASRLVEVSKNYGFLIWEGGRILNTHKHTGNQVLSSKEVQRDIDLARKRYTKGIVNVASWAGVASTWIIGPEEKQVGGDRLVPTLRRAARETVTSTTNAVRTEISAGQGSGDTPAEESDEIDWRIEDDDADLARKTSVISLTHTITQHTEVSVATSIETENDNGSLLSPTTEECEDSGVEINPPERDYPPPPINGRGLVLCVPAEPEAECADACVNLARSHSDFIIGFVSGKAWVDVSNENFLTGTKPRDNESSETFAVFAPLESEHVFCSDAESFCRIHSKEHEPNSLCLSFDLMERNAGLCPGPSRSHSHQKEIHTLHQVVARALAVRKERIKASDKEVATNSKDTEFLFIPVISMNA